MNPPDHPCQATPAGDLRQQIIDSRVPKNEREWWASREIEKLERELAAAKAERDLNITRVASILWSGAIDKRTCGDVQQWADDYTAELTRLRADLERFTGHGLLDCHAICDQRDAAVAERDRLRAELAIAENWVEHHSKHADDLIGENVRLRAEVERLKGMRTAAEAIMTDVAEANEEIAIARAERAEAELATSKSEIENLVWNLAGCSTIAQSGKPTDYSHELARPALHDVNRLAARAEKAEAECVRLKSLGSWAHTCIHHTDAERANAVCPCCAIARAEKAEAERATLATALADCISTFRSDDKTTIITAERQEAWRAALLSYKPDHTFT